MKKRYVFLSLAFLSSLVISACSPAASSEEPSSQEPQSSISSNTPTSSNVSSSSATSSNQTSSSSRSSSSSSSSSSAKSSSSSASSSSQAPATSVEPISSPEPTTLPGEDFTLSVDGNLSMMSLNCKKYVDDMRAQQQRLIEENGADADYYLNTLYGNSGVDLTKGVVASTNNYQDNTGGYRDGTTENQYLDAIGADYTKGEKSDENKGIEIAWTPSDALKNQEYTLSYGKSADLSDAKTIVTSETSARIKNLLVNQKYYFKVSANGVDSDIESFTTGDYPRWIDARPMFNVRDHGGYMTSSGQRIKQGLVYRGGEINNKSGWYGSQTYRSDTKTSGDKDGHIVTQTDAAKKVFREDMGMVNGLEIDLRSSSERNGYSACGFANAGDINYSLISISSYYNGMRNNTAQIKQLFEAFAQADQHPVYYHCYGGADRTGVVGFMLGALLGMSYTDLVIDFELTSYSSNPSRNYRGHLRNGPWNDWPGLVDYLTRTSNNGLGWGTTKTIKQGLEEYLISKCGVSQQTINKIREIMLEPAK